MFKKIGIGFVLSLLLWGGVLNKATAADVITVASTLAGAEATKALIHSAANDVSSALGFAAAQTLNQAASDLDAQTTKLREMAKTQINEPIERLGRDLQNTVLGLRGTLKLLDELLAKQRTCGAQDAHVLLAAVKGIVSDLPLIGSAEPRLTHFTFASHSIGVVPPNGGRMTLYGPKLWGTSEPPPTVQVLDRARKSVLLSLPPLRGASTDEIAVDLTTEFLAAHADEILTVHVQSRKATWMFGLFGGGVRSDLYIPLSVPATARVKYFLTARSNYLCTNTELRRLPPQSFHFIHRRCEEDDAVLSTRLAWNVPENCSIVSVEYQQGLNRHVVNQPSFGIVGGGAVDVVARVGRSCVPLPFGASKLLSHGEAAGTVTPVLRCVVTSPSETVGGTIGFTASDARACVDLPRTCETRSSDGSFILAQSFNGGPATTVYTSGRCTANAGPVDMSSSFGNVRIEATYNPGGANVGQVCTTVTTQSCGY